ncbi:MAG TPA: SDR family oxidoreductase [Aggregatilineales bacterium]|nr:SDR family oxidoreductase [Aggregatilineales bacterium]
MDLSNKIILVVGGAAGIGAATVSECAARGGAIIVADMNEAEGQTVAKSVGGLFVKVNVASQDSVQSMYQQIEERHGRLDVLLHTAGIMQGAHVPLAEFSLETFNTVINVNVVGSFLSAKYAVPLMKKAGKGTIVLVSSIAATAGSASFAYGTSKGGVTSLAITLANKLAPDNIRVNTLSPGDIDTAMKRSVLAAEAERSGGAKQFEAVVGQSNLGKPDGVAKVLAFLASDDADYVRGLVSTR